MKPTPQSKLRKKLTQKLREARASLVRVSSPFVSPVNSPPDSPSGSHSRSGSRSPSPTPPHHQHSASSPSIMGDADAAAAGGNKGRRSTFTSPMAFLPPTIAAALSSSPGALGAGGGSRSSKGSSSSKHHRKSGASLSLSSSISRSGGLSASGLFRSSVVVLEHFGKADDEAEVTAEGSAAAGHEATMATRGSLSPSPPPPSVQEEGQQPQAQQAEAQTGQQLAQPLGKPPRSPRSLLQRRGNASPPVFGRRQGAKLRATEQDRGKRDSCSLM